MSHRTRAVQEAIRRAGGVERLPVIDGPIVPSFNPVELAAALDQEIARSVEVGYTKISIHMDIRDAMRLAHFLRR